jgi:leader peptidase (prepilin peptidase)/N-methyltransferase
MSPQKIALAAMVLLSAPLLGSFIALAAYRLQLRGALAARGEPAPGLLSPPSRCDACRQPIAWFDLVPIVSWLVLRGRCRVCGHPIGVMPLAIEALALLLGGFSLFVAGAAPIALAWLVFHVLLLGCAVSDATWRRIPEAFGLVGTAVALASSVLRHPLFMQGAWWDPFAAAAGAWLLITAAYFVQARLRPATSGMSGRGDAAMLAMVGAWMGWRSLPYVVLGACALTLAYALWMQRPNAARRSPARSTASTAAKDSAASATAPAAPAAPRPAAVFPLAPALALSVIFYEVLRHVRFPV